MYEETQVLDSLKVQPYCNTLAYDIFIDEGIDSPAYYRSVISAINKVNEGDHINLFINSGGGLVSTASAIIHAMDRCRGKITAHLVGDCCSAATMISLHADEWEISDNVTYMIHCCSFGVMGSAEKVKDHHDFIQDANRDTMYREYKGLLTDEEIEQCIAGKEFWFNKKELELRLKNFIAHKESAYNQALEDSYTQQFAEEDAMVEEALAALQIPVAEREVFDKISSQLEDYFSQEQPAAKETPVVSEETASRLQEAVETLSAAEDEQVIEITNGDNYFLLHYRYDEEDEVVELELQTEDDELIVISKYALDDYERSFLLNLAKSLGVKWSHNSGKVTLIDNIVDYLEGLLS